MEKWSIKRMLLILIGVVFITAIGARLLYIDMEQTGILGDEVTDAVWQEDKADEGLTSQPPTPTSKTKEAEAADKLELNSATKDELANLPGIGQKLAERMIKHREATPFKVVRDLKKVSGIGEKKFAAICDLVYVEGE